MEEGVVVSFLCHCSYLRNWRHTEEPVIQLFPTYCWHNLAARGYAGITLHVLLIFPEWQRHPSFPKEGCKYFPSEYASIHLQISLLVHLKPTQQAPFCLGCGWAGQQRPIATQCLLLTWTEEHHNISTSSVESSLLLQENHHRPPLLGIFSFMSLSTVLCRQRIVGQRWNLSTATHFQTQKSWSTYLWQEGLMTLIRNSN